LADISPGTRHSDSLVQNPEELGSGHLNGSHKHQGRILLSPSSGLSEGPPQEGPLTLSRDQLHHKLLYFPAFPFSVLHFFPLESFPQVNQLAALASGSAFRSHLGALLVLGTRGTKDLSSHFPLPQDTRVLL
jgi:hypothetical protein